jgi:hypothetical protein
MTTQKTTYYNTQEIIMFHRYIYGCDLCSDELHCLQVLTSYFVDPRLYNLIISQKVDQECQIKGNYCEDTDGVSDKAKCVSFGETFKPIIECPDVTRTYKLCPNGYYCPNPNVAHLCPIGHYCSIGDFEPQLCPLQGLTCPSRGMSSPGSDTMLIYFLVLYIVCVVLYKYMADKLVGHRENTLDEATQLQTQIQAHGKNNSQILYALTYEPLQRMRLMNTRILYSFFLPYSCKKTSLVNRHYVSPDATIELLSIYKVKIVSKGRRSGVILFDLLNSNSTSTWSSSVKVSYQTKSPAVLPSKRLRTLSL